MDGGGCRQKKVYKVFLIPLKWFNIEGAQKKVEEPAENIKKCVLFPLFIERTELFKILLTF